MPCNSDPMYIHTFNFRRYPWTAEKRRASAKLRRRHRRITCRTSWCTSSTSRRITPGGWLEDKAKTSTSWRQELELRYPSRRSISVVTTRYAVLKVVLRFNLVKVISRVANVALICVSLGYYTGVHLLLTLIHMIIKTRKWIKITRLQIRFEELICQHWSTQAPNTRDRHSY